MFDNVDIFEWIKFNKFVDANILLLWKEKQEKSVCEWHGDHILLFDNTKNESQTIYKKQQQYKENPDFMFDFYDWAI